MICMSFNNYVSFSSNIIRGNIQWMSVWEQSEIFKVAWDKILQMPLVWITLIVTGPAPFKSLRDRINLNLISVVFIYGKYEIMVDKIQSGRNEMGAQLAAAKTHHVFTTLAAEELQPSDHHFQAS